MEALFRDEEDDIDDDNNGHENDHGEVLPRFRALGSRELCMRFEPSWFHLNHLRMSLCMHTLSYLSYLCMLCSNGDEVTATCDRP